MSHEAKKIAAGPSDSQVVLGPAHLAERLSEVPQNVELVEQDRRLRSMGLRGFQERFHMSITAIRIPLHFLGPSHS